ncbi:hypothetical protein Dsin_022662 [Dipteronia sinensis]|uniref:Uncharacterized protein n=1 Tax=Dipteronia sinensis TaxID=43782 RepID=A0AAE0A2T8_9ROSI|nr:hypothetical protein Dsin_022662 [Dipteronia sinensis]
MHEPNPTKFHSTTQQISATKNHQEFNHSLYQKKKKFCSDFLIREVTKRAEMSSNCGFKFDQDEVAFKSMDQEQKRKIGEIADSGVRSNNNLRWTSGGVYNDDHQVKRVLNNGTATTGDDNIRRRRRQEKSEMLLHLISWGPN